MNNDNSFIAKRKCRVSVRVLISFLCMVLIIGILPAYEAMAVSGDDFIAYARNYKGVAYVSAGRSPSGFDCCGFVWYVCNHFGIDVGTGNQSSQINYGTVIPYSKTSFSVVTQNMEIGDLLYFDYGSNGSIDHVAIYTGNGNIINAENSGVLEHSLNQSGWPDGLMWTSLCGVRRVLPSSNYPVVTFNANGGSCSTSSLKIGYNGATTYDLPAATLSGYTFAGWYTRPFGGDYFGEGTGVTEDITLYAHWTRNGNKITFNADGGDLNDNEITYQLTGIDVSRGVENLIVYKNTYPNTNQYGMEIAVDSGGRVTAYRPYGDTTKLTKPQGGFILSGHSNNGAGGATFVAQIHNEGYEYVYVDYSTGIVTAYKNRAAYLANTKYRNQGDTYGEMPVVSREGFIFDGWCGFGSADVKVEPSDLVSYFGLYAKWISEVTYTITYDANGGYQSSVPESQIKNDGQSITLSEKRPGYPAHSFIGWARTPNATIAEYAPGDSFTIDADTTLYAVWKNLWVVAMNTNGGQQTEEFHALLIVDGETAVLPEQIPTYEGRRFLGWSLNSDAKQADYQPGDSYTPSSDVAFYAVWQKVYASDWSEIRPAGVKDDLIETQTQYRYATKETTTSKEASLAGWTQVDAVTVLRETGWSDWSANDPPSGASAAEKRTAYGWYYYECPSCHAHLHGYNEVCWTWCGGCGASTKNASWHQMYGPTNWNVAQDWYGTGKYYATINGERWFRWDDGGTQTQWRYRTSYLETVYSYERWTDWSDWSSTPYTASETRNVETRTLYRCVIDEDRIMTLPNALTKIESEAFQNIAADAVLIPSDVRTIEDDAFDTGTVLIGKAGSYAELFAGWNNLTFIPDEG